MSKLYLISTKHKIKTIYIISLVLVIITIPVITFFYSPFFMNKVLVSISEFKILLSGNVQDGRLLSYKIGWQVIKEHPLMGTGYTNFVEQIQKAYTYYSPSSSLKLFPHNQFIFYAGMFGIPFSILFGILFYLRLLFNYSYLSLSIYIIITFYFMIDAPMHIREFYYFFCLWIPLISKFEDDDIVKNDFRRNKY